MLRSRDVIWEPDIERAVERTGLDKSRRNSKKDSSSVKKRPPKDEHHTCDNFSEGKSLSANDKLVATTNTGVTLKDLNQEDKQKIAQLIKELAKVGEEKENVVQALNSERQKFLSHVRQLEDDKNNLMNKQHFLTEEVKQCQTLLQYYQNLITMQQTTLLAQEESQKASPAKRQSSLSSLQQKEPGRTTSIEDLSFQPGDIQINEMYSDNTSTVNSSVTEDEVLRMSDNQYNAYLCGKKEKLKREQESLRKLLSLKVQTDTDLDDIQISPVRGLCDQSLSSNTTVKMKPVPMQTLSPIPSKASTSFATPSKSNQTPQKSFTCSQTQKCSASPEKILDLLSQDIADVDVQETAVPSAHPSLAHTNNFSPTSSDTSIATNVMSCDESQILQDIFFV